MSHLDQQTRYTITVEGPIDPALVDWCGPFTKVQEQMPDGGSITHLAGIATDQAGLVGIIRHLHGLGVVLLCVERCKSNQE
jgi:hypothetical protein